MSTIQEITESIIRDNITHAVSDVFKTMLGRKSALVPDAATSAAGDEAARAVPCVVGTVGFIGELNGLIYLHFDASFARVCAQQLLGMSEAEIDEAGDEVVNDAIGEITNMTVGSFKNSLCDAGFPCRLTIPSILRGTNFSIEPISSTSRYVFQFECTGHRMVADILIKSGE
ncbi:MAG TPA: chemotaxis protein CheX [Opitutus sp.]|nr:chemotaxis protein CheX [Opitutus sp.]